MTARWLVAKYMPDLRRREPMNIGVILVLPNGSARARFRAVRPDGNIDGRSARWAHSVENYRAHVAYWRHLIERPMSSDVIAEATRPLGDESYFLEFGGERLSASEPAADSGNLLDWLYAELVEETPDSTALSVGELSDAALRSLDLPRNAFHRGYRLEIEQDDVRDAVIFDYRFDNGAVHLMRNVALMFWDPRSWDSVHAALWGFERAAEHLHAERPQNYIGFVKKRDEDGDLQEQLEVLGSGAEVVDVSDPDAAAGRLAELFQLRSA